MACSAAEGIAVLHPQGVPEGAEADPKGQLRASLPVFEEAGSGGEVARAAFRDGDANWRAGDYPGGCEQKWSGPTLRIGLENCQLVFARDLGLDEDPHGVSNGNFCRNHVARIQRGEGQS
jgi:hypothetical protein